MINRILEIASKTPNKLAYINNDSSLTYKELVDKASILATKLKTYKENNIVLYGHKELFMPISILACVLSNKTYIPIDYLYPKNRIDNILKSLKSYIILSDLKLDGYKTYNIDNLPVGNNTNDSKNKYRYIIFTSGSTGSPKGVQINKDNLDGFISWISHTYPFNSYKDQVILNTASYSFDLSVMDYYYSLCNGHSIVAYDNKNDDFNYPFDLLNKYKVNIIVSTPTFIRMCLLNSEFNSITYPDIKCIFFCGEQLNKAIVRKLYDRFPNIKLINAYGPTEATCAVSCHLLNKDDIDRYDYLPVGDMNNLSCDVKVINDEIVLSGKCVFDGYLSSNTKVDVYHTNDIGEIKDDLLFCKGRLDNQIKYSGYRIELEDIESTLNSMKQIEASIVITKRNVHNEVIGLVAYVETNKNISIEDIKDYLKTRLPKYMIPSSIKIVDKLEINNNGKVDRNKYKYDKC